MEIHIGNYLDSNNYTNWSTLGLLQYLVEKENYTTEDATNIHNAFRCHLEKKSADHNMFKYARNKAERLARTLDLAEVTQFFNLSPQVNLKEFIYTVIFCKILTNLIYIIHRYKSKINEPKIKNINGPKDNKINGFNHNVNLSKH
jgi:hypothetical protein